MTYYLLPWVKFTKRKPSFFIELEGVGRNSPLGKVGDQNSKLGATIMSWGLTIKEGK